MYIVCLLFFPSITLLLIVALLGFEFTINVLHCTCSCDIKKAGFNHNYDFVITSDDPS